MTNKEKIHELANRLEELQYEGVARTTKQEAEMEAIKNEIALLESIEVRVSPDPP